MARGGRRERGNGEGQILLHYGFTLGAGPDSSAASQALTPTSTGASRKQEMPEGGAWLWLSQAAAETTATGLGG